MQPGESGSGAGREPSDEDEDEDDGSGGDEDDALFLFFFSPRWWSGFYLSTSSVTYFCTKSMMTSKTPFSYAHALTIALSRLHKFSGSRHSPDWASLL